MVVAAESVAGRAAEAATEATAAPAAVMAAPVATAAASVMEAVTAGVGADDDRRNLCAPRPRADEHGRS
jgi:hypothetical protein